MHCRFLTVSWLFTLRESRVSRFFFQTKFEYNAANATVSIVSHIETVFVPHWSDLRVFVDIDDINNGRVRATWPMVRALSQCLSRTDNYATF